MTLDGPTAALLGACIGALAATLAAFLTATVNARQEQRRHLRRKREEAYSNALKGLLQVEGMRSTFSAQGHPVLAMEHQPQWFDRLIEARHGLHQARIYASPSQYYQLLDASQTLDFVADAYSGIRQEISLTGAKEKLAELRQTVLECSQADVGAARPVRLGMGRRGVMP